MRNSQEMHDSDNETLSGDEAETMPLLDKSESSINNDDDFEVEFLFDEKAETTPLLDDFTPSSDDEEEFGIKPLLTIQTDAHCDLSRELREEDSNYKPVRFKHDGKIATKIYLDALTALSFGLVTNIFMEGFPEAYKKHHYQIDSSALALAASSIAIDIAAERKVWQLPLIRRVKNSFFAASNTFLFNLLLANAFVSYSIAPRGTDIEVSNAAFFGEIVTPSIVAAILTAVIEFKRPTHWEPSSLLSKVGVSLNNVLVNAGITFAAIDFITPLAAGYNEQDPETWVEYACLSLAAASLIEMMNLGLTACTKSDAYSSTMELFMQAIGVSVVLGTELENTEVDKYPTELSNAYRYGLTLALPSLLTLLMMAGVFAEEKVENVEREEKTYSRLIADDSYEAESEFQPNSQPSQDHSSNDDLILKEETAQPVSFVRKSNLALFGLANSWHGNTVEPLLTYDEAAIIKRQRNK